MGLKNVVIVQNRLEMLGDSNPMLKQNINVFFSRALADIDGLVEYASPLAAPGAVLISPRGRSNIADRVRVTSKKGNNWSGNLYNLQIPGYNRRMTCVKLTLEPADNA